MRRRKKKKRLQSASSSLDHPSKSPRRSGSSQACWGILRGQDIKRGKEKRSVRGMRQRAEEMELREREKGGYERDKSSGRVPG